VRHDWECEACDDCWCICGEGVPFGSSSDFFALAKDGINAFLGY
jgi:hypothetical protein